MAQSVQKITLSASRDIPFNKLLLSACNVRRIKAGVSIEQLADDIARRTLLQSITVRPVLDAAGIETGMYEIPAGGRRFRALELLVKQKRLAKTSTGVRSSSTAGARVSHVLDRALCVRMAGRLPVRIGPWIVVDIFGRGELGAAAAWHHYRIVWSAWVPYPIFCSFCIALLTLPG